MLVDIVQDIAISSMSRYVSPINPAVFPHLSVVLLSIGIFFMAWFFVYPLIGRVLFTVEKLLLIYKIHFLPPSIISILTPYAPLLQSLEHANVYR